MINTVEKGPIDAVWRLGGQDTTARGDQVVWGHFYADPSDVTWGSENNPDLFVKIWFDVSGRVDVNFFHVSVPDIEVYSDFPSDDIYDHMGTTIMDDRYIRHEYWINGPSLSCTDIAGLWYGNYTEYHCFGNQIKDSFSMVIENDCSFTFIFWFGSPSGTWAISDHTITSTIDPGTGACGLYTNIATVNGDEMSGTISSTGGSTGTFYFKRTN